MDLRKRKIVLEFPSLKDLIDYTVVVETDGSEIVRSKCLLICTLSEADIELAVRGYHAAVMIDWR